MRTLYKAKKIFKYDVTLDDGFMLVEDGRIKEFFEEKPEINFDKFEDFKDLYIGPGLVDTHIHGYKGADLMDDKEGSLNIISKGLLETGVTSFLPTSLTASAKELDSLCRRVAREYKYVEGARVRGLFLEGPYFTEKYKGAQNASYMKNPDIEEVRRWKDLSGGLLNKIGIAPEIHGVLEFIKEARNLGVYVALGHSDAIYEEAFDAVKAGANIFIHAYNAMSGLHHRNPGMVGALFETDAVGELICDGHHVHPVAAKILIDHKGKDRIALVTDCIKAGGMPDGDYNLGEFPIVVKEGTARLKEGNLAGSILTLCRAVKNVCDWDIADLRQALDMASLVPAKSVGIDDVCGSLKEGRDADFIVLSKDLDLRATYLSGEKLYEKF